MRSKNTVIKDAVALFMITLAAGICLGFVYQITKEPIAKANAQAKQKAYETVFSNARFEETQKLAEKTGEAPEYFKQNQIEGVEIQEILEANTEDGQTKGYVMTILSKEGYGGDIKLSLGIDLQGTITGLEVLSMSETAGLGARCTEKAFKSQFAGIQSEQISYTKTGKTAENEIDGISGATITTKAVTGAVNAALNFVRSVILSL